jgi:hypothetical protein
VHPLFPDGVISPATSAAIAAVKADCGDKANAKRLEVLFGAGTWAELVSSLSSSDPKTTTVVPSSSLSLKPSRELEESPLLPPAPPLPQLLPLWVWRIRRPVSMANFRLWFHGLPTRKKQFPLLAALLAEDSEKDEDDAGFEIIDEEEIAGGERARNEMRPTSQRWSPLELISGVADILEWHRVLFGAIGDRSFTRADANQITNGEVIEWLDTKHQPAARHTFKRFASTFNRGLPLVENLYECQANPFVTPRGEVDLSGSSSSKRREVEAQIKDYTGEKGVSSSNSAMTQMGLHTPVVFSLPSAPVGEVDAAGLCTPMLLRRLERAHNHLLEKFQGAATIATTETAAATTNNAGNAATAGAALGAAEDVVAGADIETAPSLSDSTPRPLCERALLHYGRARDFLPLLSRFSLQPLSGDVPGPMAFDGALLEEELARTLR